MIKKKIIILGAGLSGLSAAWHLKQKGVASVILEKEKTVGGLCRSKQVKDFIFDYDGHLLHFRNDYTLKLVKKLLKGNLAQHKRSAWINNFGILSPYPFQGNLHALPKQIAAECLWGFIHASRLPPAKSQVNFLKWLQRTFGKGICRHFMVPYNQKFWTMPLDQMICPWSDKFIPQLSLMDIVNGFFTDRGNRFGYNAVFWYPQKGGINQLALALEKQVATVSKSCCVKSIDLKNKEITIAGRGKQKFDILVTTIPLPELVKITRPLPDKILKCFKKLRWNSIFNLNLGLDGPCQDGRHWIYFPHPKTSFFRVGFFHNFSSALTPKGKCALYTEVSYSRDRPINRKKIVGRIVDDLKVAGIIGKQNRIIAQDINDIKYGYPIYDRNYFEATRLIREFLLSQNIVVCGRYGSWQYLSMEDALLDGRQVAENLLKANASGEGKV
jgi:protoporphyrinogen oxidase